MLSYDPPPINPHPPPSREQQPVEIRSNPTPLETVADEGLVIFREKDARQSSRLRFSSDYIED